MEGVTAGQLQFLGAARAVTGSKFLVTTDAATVLVDAGIYQGPRELRDRNWEDLPVAPAEIDAVVLTHAHLDHCGYVPRLVKQGFRGVVHATRRTVDLARIVLPDSGHLNEEEANYRARHKASRHHPPLPLYTEAEAHVALERFRGHPYGTRVEVARGVSARFHRAGHILGAASVELRLESDGAVVVFSGDLGRDEHPILLPPDPPPAADVIVVESTYGDRLHAERDGGQRLADAIGRTVERGGSVLIPAFAVDRTEVLLHELAQLGRQGRLPDGIPIYVDSPMALEALRVYRAALRDGDHDVRPEHARDADLFDLPNVHEVRDVEGSKALNRPDRPSIIISAAGMASGGRVVHHLAHLAPHPANTIVLVGFQAAGTRGRQLQEGAEVLRMFGRYVSVRAEVVDLPTFSVHADADELVGWLRRAPRQPDAVYVVHGEPDAANTLARRVRHELGWTAAVPYHGERVRIERAGT